MNNLNELNLKELLDAHLSGIDISEELKKREFNSVADLIETMKSLSITIMNANKGGAREGAGRPKKEDKKKAISLKLPPYLIEWMDRQSEKRPELIETALKEYYQIPEYLSLSDHPKELSVKEKKQLDAGVNDMFKKIIESEE